MPPLFRPLKAVEPSMKKWEDHDLGYFLVLREDIDIGAKGNSSLSLGLGRTILHSLLIPSQIAYVHSCITILFILVLAIAASAKTISWIISMSFTSPIWVIVTIISLMEMLRREGNQFRISSWIPVSLQFNASFSYTWDIQYQSRVGATSKLKLSSASSFSQIQISCKFRDAFYVSNDIITRSTLPATSLINFDKGLIRISDQLLVTTLCILKLKLEFLLMSRVFDRISTINCSWFNSVSHSRITTSWT